MKILFNPDNSQGGGSLTPEERQKYMILCNDLTSENEHLNYEEITNAILAIVEKNVRKTIAEKGAVAAAMMAELDEIFVGMDKDDKNYIGRINIVCLQCIILFTKYCLFDMPIEVKKDKFINAFILHGEKTMFKKYMGVINEFKDYEFMRDRGLKLLDYEELYIYLNRYEKGAQMYQTGVKKHKYRNIFLILIVEYLTLDEIITSSFNQVMYCGMASEFTYADGFLFTPLEFLHHDMAHGFTVISLCYGRSGINFKDVLSFYTFCKNLLDKENFYCVKFIIFLLFHETSCGSLLVKNTSVEELVEFLLTFNFRYLSHGIDRFLNLNDLGKAFPRAYRVDPTKSTEENTAKIIEYLNKAVTIYKQKLIQWYNFMEEGKKAGGRRTRRRLQTRRKLQRGGKMFTRSQKRQLQQIFEILSDRDAIRDRDTTISHMKILSKHSKLFKDDVPDALEHMIHAQRALAANDIDEATHHLKEAYEEVLSYIEKDHVAPVG